MRSRRLFTGSPRSPSRYPAHQYRPAQYEYYHVSVLPDQRIVLEPRVLTTPFEVSANTLKMMDSAVDNMKKGKVSPALDLSEFEEKK